MNINFNHNDSNEISDKEKEQIMNYEYVIDNIEEATEGRVGRKSIEKYENYIEECILYKAKKQRYDELKEKRESFVKSIEDYVQDNNNLNEDMLIKLMNMFLKDLLGESTKSGNGAVQYLLSILDIRITNPLMKEVEGKIEEAISRERARRQMTDNLIISFKDRMDDLYERVAYRRAINPYELIEEKEKLQQITDVYFDKISEEKNSYITNDIKDISDKDYKVVCNLKNLDIDINLSELAKKVGVTRSFISNIVNNRTNTSLLIGMKIAKVLSMKVEDIFELEEESDVLI